MVNKFTLNAQKAIKNAVDAANKLNSKVLMVEHLFIGLVTVKEGIASRLLSNLGLDPDETVRSIEQELMIDLDNTPKHETTVVMTPSNPTEQSISPSSDDNELIPNAQNETEINDEVTEKPDQTLVSEVSSQNLGLSDSNLENSLNTKTEDNAENNQNNESISTPELEFTQEVKQILQISFDKAVEAGHTYVGTEHLLLAMLTITTYPFVQELEKLRIDHSRIKKELSSYAQYPDNLDTLDEFVHQMRKNSRPSRSSRSSPLFNGGGIDNNSKHENSILESLGISLTDQARRGKLDPVIGREKEIERLMQILSRRTKNNPILLGDAGVGKTAIVEGLAQRIAFGEVSPVLSSFEVWSIDTASIVAGSQLRGDMENKVFELIKEVQDKKNIILFIDEIHTMVGAGSTGQSSLDVANILKPALARGQLHCIGATTVEEYRKSFDTDAALQRRFQPVYVDEISEEDSLEVLRQIKPIYEAFHNVRISDSAIEASVKLSVRYLKDRYLPDKAIDLIDEACARNKLTRIQLTDDFKSELKNLTDIVNKKNAALHSKRLDDASKLLDEERIVLDQLKFKEDLMKQKWERNGKVITEKDILNIVNAWTKIPMPALETNVSKTIKSLSNQLEENIIGQSYAVEQVVNSIKRSKAGLSGFEKPLASFLFVGPSGVGKTELATQLASSLFGSKEALIQVDMSELMEGHSVSKLIGSPPGYVGYDNGGQLTSKVLRNPYSVILFDEIEKASPDVLNILLQVLDKGVLTDSKGKKIDFKNTIIIMTSNIGTRDLKKGTKIGLNLNHFDNLEENEKHKLLEIEEKVKDSLKEYLSPEFLNRIDDIIVFRELSSDDVKKIARLRMKKFLNDIESSNSVQFKIKNESQLIDHIAQIGFSEVYGAREVGRALKNILENVIADSLIEHRSKTQKKNNQKVIMHLHYKNSRVQVKIDSKS